MSGSHDIWRDVSMARTDSCGCPETAPTRDRPGLAGVCMWGGVLCGERQGPVGEGLVLSGSRTVCVCVRMCACTGISAGAPGDDLPWI